MGKQKNSERIDGLVVAVDVIDDEVDELKATVGRQAVAIAELQREVKRLSEVLRPALPPAPSAPWWNRPNEIVEVDPRKQYLLAQPTHLHPLNDPCGDCHGPCGNIACPKRPFGVNQ